MHDVELVARLQRTRRMLPTRNEIAVQRDGERRPTHRRLYHRRKPVPKRPSMLDEVQDQIRTWLDGEPTISALEVLKRLKLTHPDWFATGTYAPYNAR